MNAYGYNTNRRVAKGYSRFNTIVRFLRAVIAVIAERIGAFELRVIAVAASFAVTLGIVGGMECGSIPLYIGLPVCLILAVAALLTLIDD